MARCFGAGHDWLALVGADLTSRAAQHRPRRLSAAADGTHSSLVGADGLREDGLVLWLDSPSPVLVPAEAEGGVPIPTPRRGRRQGARGVPGARRHRRARRGEQVLCHGTTVPRQGSSGTTRGVLGAAPAGRLLRRGALGGYHPYAAMYVRQGGRATAWETVRDAKGRGAGCRWCTTSCTPRGQVDLRRDAVPRQGSGVRPRRPS